MIALEQFPFFKDFPKPVLSELSQLAQLKEFKKDQLVLNQGDANNNLYFLLSGELSVFVDQGLVARLSNKGDLVGEMSLISHQKSAATIKASVDSQLVVISGDDLHQVTLGNNAKASYNIYQIYSDILVQKLEATNHRAKQLENLMDKLKKAQVELEEINENLEQKVKERTQEIILKNDELKQKNHVLQATTDKMTSLYQSRDITFSNLDHLLKKNLIPLEKSVSQLVATQTDKNLDLEKVEHELKRAIHQLEPLSTIFNAEKSMVSQKVLLADPIKKQHAIAKMALGGTGVDLEIGQTVEEITEKLNNEHFDIFIFSQEFLHLTELALKKNENMKFVYLTSEKIPSYVPKLLGHTFVPNVVSRDEEDRLFTIKNYVTTVSKLASRNYFGLEKYLSWGVEVNEFEVSRSDQRRDIIEKADQYFSQSGIRSTNRDRIKVVAEELLMNAIYDAPRDRSGNAIYNHKSRTEVVVLAENHRARFRYATDGVFMAISIEDPFGGLDAVTLFRYLEKCYSGTGSLNDGRTDKGGGGRGLHQIIENSDLVVFNIDPGSRTEVIALFNVDPKLAVIRNPNLHFFKV